MSKKHFIALADTIRQVNADSSATPFTLYQIEQLADFCKTQNPRFNDSRWIGYIRGENGPNGGMIRK